MKTLPALLVVLLVSSVATAQPKPRSESLTLVPGTYHDWHRYFDEVVVVRPIALANMRRIDVSLTASPQLELPDPGDNSYGPARDVIAACLRPFLQGLQEKLRKPGVIVSAGNRPGSDGVLVRAQITRLDPGSQAARYWGSFGAGAAKVEIRGEIVDERDRSVLIRFRQERRSGFGLVGGGYHAMLDRDIRQIGSDVAGLLNVL